MSSTEVWTSNDTFAEFASRRHNRPKPVGYGNWIAISQLSDVLRDLHRAILRTAHAAEVGALEGLLRQRLVVVFAGRPHRGMEYRRRLWMSIAGSSSIRRSKDNAIRPEDATWLETDAHLADHVIPPVPVRQWVISVLKRLRGMLADRPRAVAVLTKIFLDEIEWLLCAAAGVASDAATPASARARLGGISPATASVRRSTIMSTSTHACPTASSCRLLIKQAATPRRRSCRPGRSLRPIWPRSPSGSAAA